MGPIHLKDNRYNKQYISMYKTDKYQEIKLKKGKISEYDNFDWVSINNLHFSLIMDNTRINDIKMIARSFDKYSIDFFLLPKNIGSINNSYDFNLYYVYQDTGLLNKIDKGNILKYKNIAKAGGILSPLTSFFNWFLNILNSIVHNYGVAIILLALMIKLLLFPLTKSSLVSMRKMSELNPKMKEIQEQYKSDPQKQQQKIGELYKKEGVNPMAGCLPMLLQMPVLFALIYGLSNNVFLNGASFLWIPDLSFPDLIFKFNAPSFIPFLDVVNIRLLPILMVVFTLLQSKIQSKNNAAGTPDQQMSMKMMQYLMPIMFFFIFYEMPSALVLYWTTLNIFSIIENIIINKLPVKMTKQVKLAGK